MHAQQTQPTLSITFDKEKSKLSNATEKIPEVVKRRLFFNKN
jgi:hypothetical protein